MVLTNEQHRELATCESYLKVAQKDVDDYMAEKRDDLIGRALVDIRDHMANTLAEMRRRFGAKEEVCEANIS